MGELRECPFCGGEAHLERTGHVCCKQLGCRGFGAFSNYGTQAEQNAAAIAAWNRRADDRYTLTEQGRRMLGDRK